MKLKYKFDDFDAFSEAIYQGDVSAKIMEKGAYKAQLIQLITENVMIGYHVTNKAIIQEGVAIPGYITFLLLGDFNTRIIWRNQELNAQRVGIIYGNKEHHSHIFSHFVGTPISVKQDYLRSIVTEDLYYYILKQEVLDLDGRFNKVLQSEVKRVCYLANHDYDLHGQKAINKVLNILIKAINYTYRNNIRHTQNRKSYNRVHKTLDYISDNLTNDLSISRIANDLGESERTLRHSFIRELECSPKKYIKNILLNAVRQSILSEEKGSITELANSWGFWHMGQFSIDYKSLFGELPSETRQKKLVTFPLD